MRFSVLMVCFNAGEKLKTTLENVLAQTCRDLEVIIKDGGSTDGSLEAVRPLTEGAGVLVRVISEGDKGIYDAMNRAAALAQGEFLIFMNCGDLFYDEGVLEEVSRRIDGIEGERRKKGGAAESAKPVPPRIYYGDRYLAPTQKVEYVSPKLTPLTCYRNIPCHQSILYSKDCFSQRGFEPKYRIRADYEHFLWCRFRTQTEFHHLGMCISRYEGGGYSDSEKNRKRSAQEHREITGMYLTPFQRFYCRAYLVLTLQPLRKKLAESRHLSGAYNALVGAVYRRKRS
ncbi:MAG: glycosyltransferase [Lachnospiraceae bacterium]|nr:glycosyltransferase [Lachnospiraceae bacterium]